MEDTIAAIATPPGHGGIAIIRMSGPQALEVADRIFTCSTGRPSQFPTHTIHFGTIGHNSHLIDQVLLTIMRGPRTYTGEDTVEINCHGGPVPANQVLTVCLQNGARLAEHGEFTKRAFLNGKLDLSQAEYVMDLISSKTTRAQAAAVQGLSGELARQVETSRQSLLNVLAHLEAHVDFPEEDITPDTHAEMTSQINNVIASLKALLSTAHEGKILRQGIALAIVGRPNVGKSSLMNALLGEDRSIVTPHSGTTRDQIEETANINGIPVIITDTAGIRTARGFIEKLGIDRTLACLAEANLVCCVLDASRKFSQKDSEIIARCQAAKSLLVLNKSDVSHKMIIPQSLTKFRQVSVSATTGLGLAKLKDTIIELALNGQSSACGVTVNDRHADALRLALDSLNLAIGLLTNQASPEFVAQPVRIALNAVGEIVGTTSTDELLDRIFSTFCIGK